MRRRTATAGRKGGSSHDDGNTQLYHPTISSSLPRNLVSSSGNRSGGGSRAFLTGPIQFPPEDASAEELIRWLRGDDNNNDDKDDGDKEGDDQHKRESTNSCHEPLSANVIKRLVARRRAHNRYLASQIESGGARIDADGRIVPVLSDDDEGENDGENDDNGNANIAAEGDNEDNGIAGADRGVERHQHPLHNNVGRNLTPPRNHHRPHRRTSSDTNDTDDTGDDNVEYIPILPALNGQNHNNNRAGGRRGARGEHGGAAAGAGAAAAAGDGQQEVAGAATFRRICFAVLAVVTAFICIMLQTLPLLEGAKDLDPILDPVLNELLVMRDVAEHLTECGNLTRDLPSYHFSSRMLVEGDESTDREAKFGTTNTFSLQLHLPSAKEARDSFMALARWVYPLSPSRRKPDCSDGVLHIPSVQVLSDRYDTALIRHKGQQYPSEWRFVQEMSEEEKAEAKRLKDLYAPYKDGVDINWSLPCIGRKNDGTQVQSKERSAGHTASVEDATCPFATSGSNLPSRSSFTRWLFRLSKGDSDETNGSLPSSEKSYPTNGQSICFRGIHDNLVTPKEVENALHMASDVIKSGGDHIQLRQDVYALERSVPTVLAKVDKLFRSRYGVTCPKSTRLSPVAYRVHAALPMEGASLSKFSSKRAQLVDAVNHTVYFEWEAENHKRNNRPPFHFLRQLRPFSPKPFRDPCILMSDQQVYPEFAYHSSIFLSDGAGGDHTGGTSLYVDSHRSNTNPRRRIRRGVLIDPSRGRIVISSGGDENKRCKMPTRLGIRAVLEIWWGCK